MLDLLLNMVAALGSSEAQNILTSAGESAFKNYKDSRAWKEIIVGTGEFIAKNEQEENSFFEDLKLVLSKENLSKVAKDLKNEDGYELKHKLYKSLMQLMAKYEIPYETAESYTMRIIYTVLEQLRYIAPEKYERYFLEEWREEQDKYFIELQNRIEKMSKELVNYDREKLSIKSSGQIDIELRRSTEHPSIGIDFFIVDDEHFQDEFEDLRYEEIVFIKGRNREETIYCVLNELWRLNDKRPIYVVKNLESWEKLQSLENEGNVYIPWFYADEIVAIENNTNIFILDDNTPSFGKNVLELRPRTRETLSKCLQNAGLEYSKVYDLLLDTHGLYSQMKKQLFKGEYLKDPSWLAKVSDKAKKTCLLVGSWEEIEGDKLIIESIYGNSYDSFLEEVLPYTKGEDPLLYIISRNGSFSYYLASTENIWSYIDILPNERIWKNFIKTVYEVLNESENLFTYDSQERLIAQFNGETLFWSETIRRGMLKTLLIKGTYQDDIETQLALNALVKSILDFVKTEKQWIYISRFWKDLCEISPTAVLERIEHELVESTGLFSLFQNQSSDFLFGHNSYIDILWGIEQFLVQKEYFWSAFRWLLELDSRDFHYVSNSPKDIFEKVFCTWMNFSLLQNAEEKTKAAELAFEINQRNTWDYLYSATSHNGRSIFGELSSPKFREHTKAHSTTIMEMRKTSFAYINLLMKHMDFSPERWKKLLNLSTDLDIGLIQRIFDQLFYELDQMSDEEVMYIKNEIRHIIFRHRYFASSDWAMSENKTIEYESLLNRIKINTPEFDYSYLFISHPDYPLLNPVPYNEENNHTENEKATQYLIKDRLLEFSKNGYNLTVLATICSKSSYSQLGKYLAIYWNDGKWDYAIFKELLTVQESGVIALDYLQYFQNDECISYERLVEDLSKLGCTNEILASVYRIEATITNNTPLVTKATETIKKEFWKNTIYCQDCNYSWALKECKNYATLNVYLDQIYRIHYKIHLSAEEIYECFEGIEKMQHTEGNQMTSYHVEQLISIIQDAYINDNEKCYRISHIELFFMNLLEWKNMKCFHRMIKQSPEILAQIIACVFKKDHDSKKEHPWDQAYIHNMYQIYDKAHFCPAETNGEVNENNLEYWIKKYRQLLIDNDQESIFTSTLGRLFSYSPVGTDNHEPCEAVRKMIEKYGDEKLITGYEIAVYNRRGIFSPSAGKVELKMAEEFKQNAQYLEPNYPKTAKIFYNLYNTYKRESDRERMDAENGWY